MTWEEWEEYRKAVTEGKSEVEDMTERETRAKENWRKRRRKPPRVPGMPWKSLRVCRGIALSVSGGASTGWTAGWTIDITAAAIRTKRRSLLSLTKTASLILLQQQQQEGSRWTKHSLPLFSVKLLLYCTWLLHWWIFFTYLCYYSSEILFF